MMLRRYFQPWSVYLLCWLVQCVRANIALCFLNFVGGRNQEQLDAFGAFGAEGTAQIEVITVPWLQVSFFHTLPTCYTSLITWTQPGKFWCNLQLHLTTSSGFPETGHGQGCYVMLYFRLTSMKTFRREVQACSFEVGFEQNFVLNWSEKWRCGGTSRENSTSSGLPWILRNILVPGSVPCPFEGQCGTQIFHPLACLEKCLRNAYESKVNREPI